MKLNKLVSGIVVGATLGLASIAASASTYNVTGGTFSNIGTVNLDGANHTFSGSIGSSGFSSVLFNLGGSVGGDVQSTESTFTVGVGDVTNFSLYKQLSGNIYDFIANGTNLGSLPNNGNSWTLSTWISTGNYALRIDGTDNSTYAGAVSAVPLPAAAWLFGSAFLGLGALRRKQKAGDKSEMALA